MPKELKTYRVFISAAEASGDTHCAALITAVRQTGCAVEFVGVGGPKMAEAGCNLIESTVTKAAMAYKAFAHIFRFWRLIRRITRFFRNNKVDLVIVCDSPAFNFHIAKAAKKNGVKTLFYVAPQLWAWGSWRITKLNKYCDKLCCILPFEEKWFAQKGIDTVFVGNPVLDELDFDLYGHIRKYTGFDPQKAIIALMPGSREAEIDALWPAMQHIALHLRKKHPGVRFVTAAVDEQGKEILKSYHAIGFKCEYNIDSLSETALTADFAIVASGSATLQVAAVGCPMVIMYQSSRLLWHLVGRWLLKIKYLSLVNILAERQLVPEFMPYFTKTDPIAETVEQMLTDNAQLAQLSRDLVELVTPLRQGKAAEKTAQITREMLDHT